jgi:hypothetical protein
MSRAFCETWGPERSCSGGRIRPPQRDSIRVVISLHAAPPHSCCLGIKSRVDNVQVPFTPAHAAAALPFRRSRLVPSALVIGTFAPDFEYLLRLAPRGRFGHTPLGALVLTLPVALLVLWTFHSFIKQPAAMLLPEAVRRRLPNASDKFRFGGPARFLLIIASILFGIATHLLWDSFTHSNTWPYRHWAILRQPFTLPIAGEMLLYKILQHSSTVLGMGIVAAWLVVWYWSTPPSTLPTRSLPSTRKAAIIALMITIALAGATLRGLAGTSPGNFGVKHFAARAVVTAFALTWWQLLAYGLFVKTSEPRGRSSP